MLSSFTKTKNKKKKQKTKKKKKQKTKTKTKTKKQKTKIYMTKNCQNQKILRENKIAHTQNPVSTNDKKP